MVGVGFIAGYDSFVVVTNRFLGGILFWRGKQSPSGEAYRMPNAPPPN